MGTKNNPSTYDCYANAEDDEPMFVLLARDPRAPVLVEAWAEIREVDAGLETDPFKVSAEKEKVQEALRCAREMRDWYEKNR